MPLRASCSFQPLSFFPWVLSHLGSKLRALAGQNCLTALIIYLWLGNPLHFWGLARGASCCSVTPHFLPPPAQASHKLQNVKPNTTAAPRLFCPTLAHWCSSARGWAGRSWVIDLSVMNRSLLVPTTQVALVPILAAVRLQSAILIYNDWQTTAHCLLIRNNAPPHCLFANTK